MKRWVPLISGGIAFIVLLASGENAWAVGVLRCDVSDPSDFFTIENGGADSNPIAIFVTATGDLFGGPKLDPRVEVRNLATDAFIACNDDHNSAIGGCSLANTSDVTGLSTNFGTTPLFAVGAFDSLVIFNNPPAGVLVEVTASTDVAVGRSDCGTYSVQILGVNP
jgi:hypothetical protein